MQQEVGPVPVALEILREGVVVPRGPWRPWGVDHFRLWIIVHVAFSCSKFVFEAVVT